MKNLVAFTTIILALIIITGCKKGSNSTTGVYYMKATVDGKSFSADGLSKVYQTSSSSGGMNFIYITGKSDDGQLIELTLINNSGTPLIISTIPLNTGVAAADYYPKGLDSAYTKANSGSIVISALTPNIQGTFNFICLDSTVVINGSFSVYAQR